MMKLKLLSNSSIESMSSIGNKAVKRRIAVVVFAALLPIGNVANTALKVEVTEGVAGGVPVSVLPFGSPPSGKREFGSIIASDLAYSGLFSVIPSDNAMPLAIGTAVDYRYWLSLGVEKLIFGSVAKENEVWRARVELHDVAARVRVFGYEVTSSSFDYAAHHISDSVYKELTGFEGIFRSRLAFVTSTRQGWRSHNFFLHISDADGYNAVPIFTSKEQLMSPVWSPDIKKLAYVSYESGQPEIIIQTLASAKRVNLGKHIGTAVSPNWSKDGRHLAYVSSERGNPDIYTVQLDNMQVRRVTDNIAIDTEPVYLHDGTIIFTSDRSGRPQLYQSQLGGGKPERLTYNEQLNADADISPDGNRIVFLSWSRDEFSIILHDLISGSEVTLIGGNDLERPRFTANGQLLGYLSQGRLTMLTTDGLFGSPVRIQAQGNIRGVSWSPLIE